MAFAYTWNTAFEALPADTDDISDGALKIRDHKKAVAERMKISHSWAGDAKDGLIKDGLYTEIASGPTTAVDEGAIYFKDLNSVPSPFWRTESSGTEREIADVSTVQTLTNKTLTTPTITDPAISGSTKFTGGVEIETTAPYLRFDETDAAANKREIDIRYASGIFRFTLRTDAGAVQEEAYSLSRNADGTAGVHKFENGTLQVVEAVTFDGALTIAGKLIQDDTTNTTSGTTGSIQTDGGLGVLLDIFCDGKLMVDVIDEAQTNAGVTIEAAKIENGLILASDGTLTLPTYGFTNKTNTGMYLKNTSGMIGFTLAGSNLVIFNETAGSLASVISANQSSSTGAKPALALQQADLSEDFVDFVATSDTDGSKPVSSDTTEDSAKFGAVRIGINGTLKWIRIYDDHS